MCVPKLAFAFVFSFVLGASVAAAQEPNPQAMQMQAQKIAQERPREAEAAARAFLMLIAQDRVRLLDTLKAHLPDVYWTEVGQLTVQFDMVQNLARRDSARAALVTQMFGLEVFARELQRAYRYNTSEENRGAYRIHLESLIGRHFDIENQLRALEIKDIERRLAEVRAETQRRVDKRTEFIRFAVDDIIRDATRPQ